MRPVGLEPTAFRLSGGCSNLLSYARMRQMGSGWPAISTGFEPAAFARSGIRRSYGRPHVPWWDLLCDARPLRFEVPSELMRCCQPGAEWTDAGVSRAPTEPPVT